MLGVRAFPNRKSVHAGASGRSQFTAAGALFFLCYLEGPVFLLCYLQERRLRLPCKQQVEMQRAGACPCNRHGGSEPRGFNPDCAWLHPATKSADSRSRKYEAGERQFTPLGAASHPHRSPGGRRRSPLAKSPCKRRGDITHSPDIPHGCSVP